MASSSSSSNTSANHTLQFLFPMGGLGTRFAQAGIPTPKPLIPVDGSPMIHKALSSFDELMRMSTATTAGAEGGATAAAPLAIRVVFVVREEHETAFKLRTQLAESFRDKYSCNEFWCVNRDGADLASVAALEVPPSPSCADASPAACGSSSMSVYFVMMHADTQGAAETCLLAAPALLPASPVVILDCDLYVYSSRLNSVLVSMASRGAGSSTASSSSSPAGSIPGTILSSLRGALVFFNSRAPRYSYAIVEPIEGVDLSDPKGLLTAGGRVTRTAEKVPISNCSLIGAYTFAAAGWFVAAAKRLVAQPINPDTGLKEYYISLLYNFLLEPSFAPEGIEGFEAPAGADEVLVLAVPKEGYASFGTPDELANYNAGRDSYVLE